MRDWRYLMVYSLICLIGIFHGRAESRALIVEGLADEASAVLEINDTANALRQALAARGFPATNVQILGGPDRPVVNKIAILKALESFRTLHDSDEFWLILLGFSNPDSNGAPAYQIHGPRMSAGELKTALEGIIAHQKILIGTSNGGGFIPVLLNPHREVLSATASQGELDLPRFPDSWSQAMAEHPQGSWRELAARAAQINDEKYQTSQISVSEHAQLGDPETGKILKAPFGVDSKVATSTAPTRGPGMEMIRPQDIKVEIHDPNAEWEHQTATPETRKLIASAKSAPNPDQFSSLILAQQLEYTVSEDRTAEDHIVQRVYLAGEDGVSRWATASLPQDPPAITTRLEMARIIQPDGSAIVYNPAKLPAASNPEDPDRAPRCQVFFPETHAGCVIEIAYRTKYLLDASMPCVSSDLPLQKDVPALATTLTLRMPEGDHLHYRLRNSLLQPASATLDGRTVLTWSLPLLPAYQPLPHDPPARDLLVALEVSSINSWDEFSDWFHRIAAGSDQSDASVHAAATALEMGAKDRLDKIHRAFDFVSSFRYIAIEGGINGFRPRTPAAVLHNRYGDCKDKANLLVALLREVGIEGHLTLLNRGSSTDVDFPSWQFNHAIAWVPKAPEAGQPEDLWLDTTDSTAPFPTLPLGDIDRQGFIILPKSGRFQKVANGGQKPTQIEQLWRLQADKDGGWSGSLEESWSGLAEYRARSELRGASPLQRSYGIQQMLSLVLPEASFHELRLTPTDDLSIPLHLSAVVSCPQLPHPQPALSSLLDLAPSDRDRPLLVNDGQPFRFRQTLELAGLSRLNWPLPQNYQDQAAGFQVSIHWEQSQPDHLRRIAELDASSGTVASNDYAAVRRLVYRWTAELNNPLNLPPADRPSRLASSNP